MSILITVGSWENTGIPVDGPLQRETLRAFWSALKLLCRRPVRIYFLLEQILLFLYLIWQEGMQSQQVPCKLLIDEGDLKGQIKSPCGNFIKPQRKTLLLFLPIKRPILKGIWKVTQISPALLTCLGKNKESTLKSSWMTEDHEGLRVIPTLSSDYLCQQDGSEIVRGTRKE